MEPYSERTDNPERVKGTAFPQGVVVQVLSQLWTWEVLTLGIRGSTNCPPVLQSQQKDAPVDTCCSGDPRLPHDGSRKPYDDY